MSHPPVARRTPTWLWLVLGLVVLMLLAGGVTAAVYLTRRLGGGPAKGDVAYTLRLSTVTGGAPDAGAVDRTRQILADRLRASGVGRPNVTAAGPDTLRVTVAADDAERARPVLAPGRLTFRKVLAQVRDVPMFGDRPNPGCQAGVAQSDPGGPAAAARSKLGEATYRAAEALTDPEDPAAAQLKGFDKLSCPEIAALPAAMQYAVPAITCPMLNERPAGAPADDAGMTACEDHVKYRLDVARVNGGDVAGAEAGSAQGMWAVTVHFTPSGQGRWTDLTREAVDQQVAILLDNRVVSAPTIQAVIPGDAQISGQFDKRAATGLAATLGSGVLPTLVTITAVGTVD